MTLHPFFAAALQLLIFTSITTARPTQKSFQRRAGVSPGPVIATDFADPSLLNVDGTWYSFGTSTRRNGKGYRIQAAASFDFNTWSVSDQDAIAYKPEWVNQTRQDFWAPDVSQVVSQQSEQTHIQSANIARMMAHL